MTEIPIIETERLVLRAPKRADFDTYGPMLMSERAQYIGGPFTLPGAWRDFSNDVASWVLNGFGPWAIESRETGEFLGIVGPQRPPYFPET
nr:GNAT family N-acetyltransferase [Paracoccaceae bacterium]